MNKLHHFEFLTPMLPVNIASIITVIKISNIVENLGRVQAATIKLAGCEFSMKCSFLFCRQLDQN